MTTVPAATVILLRDWPAGIETLLLRRHRDIEFAEGAWVFPGGRVDEADRGADEEASARRAAARECAEEAGLVVAPDDLVPFAHYAACRRGQAVRDVVLRWRHPSPGRR